MQKLDGTQSTMLYSLSVIVLIVAGIITWMVQNEAVINA